MSLKIEIEISEMGLELTTTMNMTLEDMMKINECLECYLNCATDKIKRNLQKTIETKIKEYDLKDDDLISR